LDMSIGNHLNARSGRRSGRGRKNRTGKRQYRPLPIWNWIGLYLALFILSLTSKVALFSLDTGWSIALSVLIHLLCGYILNVVVLRNIGFHHVYSTLRNVAVTKFVAFVLWPLTYPVIFVQLLVVRYL